MNSAADMEKAKAVAEFLKGADTSCSIGYDIFLKGGPQDVAVRRSLADGGKESNVQVQIIPLYKNCYSQNEDCLSAMFDKVPYKMEFVGFWIPEKSCFVSDSTYTGGYPATGTCGITHCVAYEVVEEMRKSISDRTLDWIDENILTIPPADGFDESRVADLFNRGHVDIDIMKQTMSSHERFIQEYGKKKMPNVVKWIFGDTSEVEEKADSICGVIHDIVSRLKAERAELLKRINAVSDKESLTERIRRVKSVLLDLYEKGTKSCTAVFDFGYAKSTQKVGMKNGPSMYTIGSSDRAESEFYKTYRQPIVMGCYSNEEKILAYITRIESRKKTVYEAAPFENRAENELYNAVIRSDDKDFIPERFEGKNLDCSIQMPDGLDLLVKYASGFYSSVDGLDFLIKHGADPSRLKQFINEKGCCYRRSCSRNMDKIEKYLETV